MKVQIGQRVQRTTTGLVGTVINVKPPIKKGKAYSPRIYIKLDNEPFALLETSQNDFLKMYTLINKPTPMDLRDADQIECDFETADRAIKLLCLP